MPFAPLTSQRLPPLHELAVQQVLSTQVRLIPPKQSLVTVHGAPALPAETQVFVPMSQRKPVAQSALVAHGATLQAVPALLHAYAPHGVGAGALQAPAPSQNDAPVALPEEHFAAP